MIDGIGFDTNQEFDFQALENCCRVQIAYKPHWGKIRRYYHLNGSTIHVKSFPNFISRTDVKHRVEVNPNRFETWAELLQFLNIMFPRFNIGEPRIKRLDLFVDDAIRPVTWYRDTMKVFRKKYCNHYETTSTSVVIGKRPERTTIYDRAARLKLSEGTTLTRIEVQYHSKKLPVSRFTELPKLIHFDPFSKLKFGPCSLRWDIATTHKKEMALRYLRDLLNEFGFHAACQRLNKQGHLQKTFGKYFGDVQVPNLTEMFHKNIRKFFEINQIDNNAGRSPANFQPDVPVERRSKTTK